MELNLLYSILSKPFQIDKDPSLSPQLNPPSVLKININQVFLQHSVSSFLTNRVRLIKSIPK